MFVFDTRNPEAIVEEWVIEQPKKENTIQLELQPMAKNNFEPDFMMIFQRIVEGLHGPMMTIKDQISNITQTKLKYQNIPWFKVGLVLLAGFILMKKDMRFNIALSSPAGYVTDEEQDNTRKLTKNASLSNIANPYAPVSSKDLRVQQTQNFIKQYSSIAVESMHQFGIPASIKMAQALIESRAGQSMLARKNNNHFGMKCFSKKCAKGHCTNAYDDHHKDFFRKYKTAVDSWAAHSRLLSQGRYKPLHKHKLNYKKWATGLKKAGYATDKNYDKKLISVIKKYNLDKLDQL